MSSKKENINLSVLPGDKGINVLMTGAGAPGAAGIMKCLWHDPAINIIVADMNPHATGRYLNDHPVGMGFEIIPPATDPLFIESMLSICRKENIHIVLPLVTKELIPLSEQLTAFELAGAKVMVSSTASLEIANNKSRLYEFLQWRGIKVPEFRVIETVEQFKDAAKELNYPQHPICFKPSVSNGSRGFRIIHPDINESQLLFNEKPNSTYISYNDAIRILSSQPFPELLLSEWLPGDEYSVDCLANHGHAVVIVPRLRKKLINGISTEGEIIKDEYIISYCTQIIKELQLHGNIGIQVKRSAKNEFLIIEINPRVQGTISAGLGAGINLPLLAVKQELGLTILPEELQVKWGTCFSRYWNEVFY